MPAALLSLLIALLLDLLLSDPPNKFHPVAAMGGFIRWAEGRRKSHSPTGQFLYGMVLVLSGGLLFSLPWSFLLRLFAGFPDWMEWLLVGLFLKPVFSLRRLIVSGLEVKRALVAGDLSAARELVAWHLVSRDTSGLSNGQVASAAIESLAENLTDSFLAPLSFFSIGGLPLAWFYRFANTADAMIGYHSPQYEYLGKFAARLDDILNWLPARLAALTLVLSAWLCRMDAGGAWSVMAVQHKRTSSPNAGWTMAAAAGALGVCLEKVGVYRLNEDCDLPEGRDIQSACVLVSLAALICVIIIGGVILGLEQLS